MENILKPYNT